MKSVMFVSLILVLAMGIAMAGGIVTNTNQSAAYVRTLNRNASTDIDAVYFNPAGLTRLEDGLYLSLSNQTIWQTKTIINNTPNLNDDEFVGEVFVPVFPSFYLAYKTGKLAFSAGFEPIGGGGSVEYKSGLPSFETPLTGYVGIPASYLNPALDPYGNITGYSLDAYFKGSSIYYGGQIGVAYSINDMFSVAAGARYVYVKNSYEGNLKNIALQTDGGLGNIEGIQNDMEVDAIQTGSGITPIFSAFITPFEELDIALRYEVKTKLELENETEVDGSGLFPDGGITNADMPAMMAVGVAYKVMPALRAEFNLNYYMNSDVNWDGREDNVESGYEAGVAVEYCLSDKLKASVGFLNADGGAKAAYQTDMSYSLKSNTIGLGFAYAVSPNLVFNVGGLNTFYQEDEKAVTGITEKYQKTSVGFAIGVDYKL